MNKNVQLISVLSLTAALAACGGSSSSGGGGGSTATSVTGTASKGIIMGGTVTAYPLVNGAPDTANPLGTATTGADGTYSLDLPSDYDGSPIVVTVTPASDGSTTMRCDIPSGCGTGVVFGDDYTLASGTGFSMSAILAEATAGQSVTVNPTPLTEVATQVALDALASATSPTEFMIEDAIADANSATADRFGITGDLNEQPVIDITDPTEVATATTDAIVYNSLAGAIVEATLDDNSTLTIEEAIDAFATNYVDDGGIAGNTATSGTTSLQEIFDAAGDVLTATSNEEGGDQLDLTAVNTSLTTESNDASSETPDTPDSGTPSDTAADGELAQVKAMVADIRDIGAATSTTLNNTANAFADEIDAASIATEAGTNSAMAALGSATEAVTEALTAYELDPTLTSFTASNGIVVGLSTGGSLAAVETVAITATVDVAAHNVDGFDNAIDLTFGLSASLDYVETGTWAPNWPQPGESGSGSATEDGEATMSLSIAGTVTNSDVELRVTDGNVDVSATIDGTETWSQSDLNGVVDIDETEQFDATLSFSFDLDVTLTEQVTSGDAVSFNGTFGFSIQGVTLDEEETFVYDSDMSGSTESDSWDSTVGFNTLDLSLGGTFTKGAQSFDASFVLSAAGNGVTYNEVGQWSGSWSSSQIWQGSETITETDTETASNYVDISVNLSFEAVLTGIADPVTVTFGVSRSGLEEGTASLDLDWEGNHLDFDLTGGETGGTATILNQDGVSAALSENAAGELSGTISNGTTQYATIDDQGIIRYVDGVVESL